MKGKFITFEGCEGVGKSTQMRLLQEYFRNNNINAVFTREPGGVRICETIRGVILNKEFTEMSPVCEAMLYAASRA
jgi:dTMP kinase